MRKSSDAFRPPTTWRLPLLTPFLFLLCISLILPHLGLQPSSAACLSDNTEWRAARRVLQQSNVSTTYLKLAQDRTERPDPLNNFYTYRDGWDVRNKYYWASVGYTGAPGFVLAGAWLATGLATLFVICGCCCCCRHRLRGSHRGGNFFSLIFLLVFTGIAVIGCVVLYVGQGKSNNELSATLDYVVGESELVVNKLRNTSAIISESQSIVFLQFALPASRKAQIENLDTQLNVAAITLETKTKDNAQNISDVLNRVRLSMIVVAGVMLLLVALGFLFSVLGMTVLMYMLILIVWILVAGTWILCGVYIMLNNVVGDTCVSMEEWVANPSAQTNLQDILPCVDINTTDRALEQAKIISNDTITGINGVITAVLNNGSQTQGLPLMCNPIQPNLNSPGCVDTDSASQKWLPYVCSNPGASQDCQLGGRLTPQLYSQLNTSVFVINGLNESIPFLLDLANCQFVRQVFTNIREQHCHPLRDYISWQFIGLALLSGGLMFSIWLWIIFNRRRRHRFFHHIQDHGQFIASGPTGHQPSPKAAP